MSELLALLDVAEAAQSVLPGLVHFRDSYRTVTGVDIDRDTYLRTVLARLDFGEGT